ncbi:MAG: AAA family ATPase [candidate division NC10 bacterium RIFCSPLOWO2_02_FULL_66_22]|nr:MAG: AAA family ATPase [candidate division NC10 bacterium RIFCSPLOWO2_02_FULL_66_22]
MSLELFPRESPPPRKAAPLADRMRPRTLEEFVGQAHLLAEGKVLRVALEQGEVPSLILWGPPGTGKTSLAILIAGHVRAAFIPFSAVTSGIKEIREVIAEADRRLRGAGQRTILFVDEIHRFNKAQQDAFLPHVERGTITLIGATTENPSFEVIAPLLSRTKVLVLHPLSEAEIRLILDRALKDPDRGLGKNSLQVAEDALAAIARWANGDARAALNLLDLSARLAEASAEPGVISLPIIQEAAQRRSLLYDKAGEEHFNLISALHKSLRDSDPDGALYWLARMLASGEDPLYIARRLIRFASEDIGNADPQALSLAVAAKEAYHFLGTPEGELALAQCVTYLATAPKSNAVYVAFNEAQADVASAPAEPVPLHIRNAPTPLMKDLGYGEGYKYAHDYQDAQVEQDHLPASLRGRVYYRPTDRGLEAEIQKRLAAWRRRTP